MSLSVASAVITISDFGKICRICLGKEKLCPIQRTYIRDKKIAELMEYSVMSDVKNEFLPQNICHKCLNDLYKFCKFKKQCEDNENMLKNLLESVKCDDVSSDENFEYINVDEFKMTLVDESLKFDEEDISEHSDFKSNILLDETSKPDKDKTKTAITENLQSKIPSVDENIELESNRNKVREQKCSGPKTRNKKCPDCDFITTNRKILHQHLREFHSRLKCEICKKTLRRRSFRSHMLCHTKPYKCEICFHSFCSPKDVRRHKLVHTEERPHMCGTCGKCFKQVDVLREHERQVHEKKILAPQICSFCGKECLGSKALYHHEKNHLSNKKPRPQITQQTCGYCGRTFKHNHWFNAHVKKHQDGQTKKPRDYVCETCGRIFKSKQTLAVHKTLHEEKKFLCSDCGKRFVSKSRLDMHCRVHTGEKPYACKICQKVFAYKPTLLSHMKTHTGDKPHKCSVCSRSFSQKTLLRYHMRIHSGEKPYSCSYCNEKFISGNSLKRHIRAIHTGERPYVCHVCDKSYIDLISLKRHKKIHENARFRAELKKQEEEEHVS